MLFFLLFLAGGIVAVLAAQKADIECQNIRRLPAPAPKPVFRNADTRRFQLGQLAGR